MIRFNGFYGCNFCEHPTEGVDGYRRYTMSTCVPPNRTDTSVRYGMQNALNDEIHPIINKRIKGSSVLINLEKFDLIDGMVPDYMHSVLLGVTRQYTEIILTSRRGRILCWFAKSVSCNKSTSNFYSTTNMYHTITKNT